LYKDFNFSRIVKELIFTVIKKLDKTSEVKVDGQLHLELSQFPPQLLSSFCCVFL